MTRAHRSRVIVDQNQQTSFSGFNPISGTADTTSLSHDEAAIRHRHAYARCLAAGWIEAAEYHRRVADWHVAFAT
jgi:hypothetical protein